MDIIADLAEAFSFDELRVTHKQNIVLGHVRLADLHTVWQQLDAAGAIRINISGCINACGHHHVGDIGILGVDRRGEEYYQITLGGDPADNATIGEIIGPSFSYDEIVDAIETIISTYETIRKPEETFSDTWRRTGATPFKETLYGPAHN